VYDSDQDQIEGRSSFYSKQPAHKGFFGIGFKSSPSIKAKMQKANTKNGAIHNSHILSQSENESIDILKLSALGGNQQ
jgi:hypothetical protein